ncbi:MAG: diaminopimelate decarboxylase [Bacteroidota bacterium]
MQEFNYRDNELVCEGTSLNDVAERFGTPLYVYSKQSIVDHCNHIERAFGGQDHLTCYAAKANNNPALMRVIAGEGLGADVVSRGELHLALKAGFPTDRITYSSVGKRDDEIVYALENNILAFNVESFEELDVLSRIAVASGKTARILLRVNLDIEAGGHSHISTGTMEHKFGIEWRKAAEALRRAGSMPMIEVRGIHSHIGSQITKAETFMKAAEALVALVQQLRRDGIDIKDLDFGGGFGVQYRGYVQHPFLPDEALEELNLSAATLVRTVLPILRESGCRLSIQPGRSIIAHAGVLLVKVLYRKETGHKVFIVVDGGMNDLIRPSLYNAYHQIVPLTLQESPVETVDVVGPLCESGDFFALDRKMSRVQRGDYLALMCAGAYGYVLSSNYNARPRPAEVLIDGATMTVVRERELIEEL